LPLYLAKSRNIAIALLLIGADTLKINAIYPYHYIASPVSVLDKESQRLRLNMLIYLCSLRFSKATTVNYIAAMPGT
jgi:hypothetical protein